MAPWIFFLFMAVLDIGFYLYAAINTQNAARAAVIQAANQGATPAPTVADVCTLVLQEVGSIPVPGGAPSGCGGSPVKVDVNTSATGLDGDAPSARVTVTVTTLPMIPIPGLMGQLTIQRTAQARFKDNL